MPDIDCRNCGLMRGKANVWVASEGVVGVEPALALATAFALINSEVSISEIETA
jgi:hypothetical protein